jgi:hypothetical protein
MHTQESLIVTKVFSSLTPSISLEICKIQRKMPAKGCSTSLLGFVPQEEM